MKTKKKSFLRFLINKLSLNFYIEGQKMGLGAKKS